MTDLRTVPDGARRTSEVQGMRSSGPRRWSWSPELTSKQGAALATPFMILIALFLVYPLIRLILMAVGGPDGLGNLMDVFGSAAKMRALGTTFWVSGVVTVLSIAAGALIAWSLKTSRSKWMKAALLAAVLLPFWMGTVMKLYAWTVMLQSFGVINRFLTWTGVVDEPLDLLYNELAVVVGMSYQMLPYAVLPLAVAFSSIDLDMIRAAQSLGASRMQAIRSVVVPLAIPGTLATVTLVYVMSIGFFLTPVVLGGFTAPFSASLISQDIFVFFDLPSAAATSLVLLLGGLLIVLLGYLLVGKQRLRKAMG